MHISQMDFFNKLHFDFFNAILEWNDSFNSFQNGHADGNSTVEPKPVGNNSLDEGKSNTSDDLDTNSKNDEAIEVSVSTILCICQNIFIHFSFVFRLASLLKMKTIWIFRMMT